MRTVPMSEVTANMVVGAGAIYVTDGVFAEVVSRDLHLSPMYAASTPAMPAAEPLYILVEILNRESFLAVLGHLRCLGFRREFEAPPEAFI